MQAITNISTSVIKVHPRNTEFFDDIKGADYESFKNSISVDGILTPLIVANDMTLLSGHQRLKAAVDLDIQTVPVILKNESLTEDEKLKVLLAANFGRSEISDKQKRRIAFEYVRLCGIRSGQHSSKGTTQPEIAKKLGVSVTELNRMLDIENKLTPEVVQLLDNGVFTKTTAATVMARLTKSEQLELLSTFGDEIIQGATQRQMRQYAERIQNRDIRIKELEAENARLEKDIDIAEDRLDELQDNLPEDVQDVLAEKSELEYKYRKEYERAEKIKKELIELRNKKPEVQIIESTEKDSAVYGEFAFDLFSKVCYSFMSSTTEYKHLDVSYSDMSDSKLHNIKGTLEQLYESFSAITQIKDLIDGILNGRRAG